MSDSQTASRLRPASSLRAISDGSTKNLKLNIVIRSELFTKASYCICASALTKLTAMHHLSSPDSGVIPTGTSKAHSIPPISPSHNPSLLSLQPGPNLNLFFFISSSSLLLWLPSSVLLEPSWLLSLLTPSALPTLSQKLLFLCLVSPLFENFLSR